MQSHAVQAVVSGWRLVSGPDDVGSVGVGDMAHAGVTLSVDLARSGLDVASGAALPGSVSTTASIRSRSSELVISTAMATYCELALRSGVHRGHLGPCDL